MNIEEAIIHCEKIACSSNPDFGHISKCQDDHRQLAEWLKELREYKNTGLEPEKINDAVSIQHWEDALKKQNDRELKALREENIMMEEENQRLRIAEAPAVDAVEVVRCKDCYAACDKDQGEILRKEGCVYCLIHEEWELPDEYCSYGRRKKGRG